MSTTPSTTESQSQRAPIPAADADLETTWRFLEEGLGHIMSGDQISYMDYQELYTVAYNCMTVSRMPNQSQAVANAQSDVFLYTQLRRIITDVYMPFTDRKCDALCSL